MPTETFYNLSDAKKKKIIEAGKHEFSRVSIQDASIKNIVEEAEIARGSFYQYFSDKQDLLLYILEVNNEKIEKQLDKILEESNGNVFDLCINVYDDMTEKCFNSENHNIYVRIFENAKESDDSIYEQIKKNRKEKFQKFKDTIDSSNLKIEEEEDFDRILEILAAIVRSSIIKSIKKQSKEKSRKEFIRKIELTKKGIEK